MEAAGVDETVCTVVAAVVVVVPLAVYSEGIRCSRVLIML
jgi:hypothetical protein